MQWTMGVVRGFILFNAIKMVLFYYFNLTDIRCKYALVHNLI